MKQVYGEDQYAKTYQKPSLYQMLQVELLPLLKSWTNLPALTVIGFTIKQEDRKQP